MEITASTQIEFHQLFSVLQSKRIAVIHPLHVVVSSSDFILLAMNFQLSQTSVYARYHVGREWTFRIEVLLLKTVRYQQKFRPDIYSNMSY
jgi:hypothetical protein